MSEKDKPAANAQDKPAEQQQPTTQVDAAKVAAEARTAERTRINGILGCEEAKGRQTLAQHLASQTDMSVEDAKKTLAASPVEGAAKGGFSAAMGKLPNPKVGADAGSEGEEDADAMARRIAGVPPVNAPAH